jgi:DNA-directed RNA polymerase specialized sigma24 family protein
LPYLAGGETLGNDSKPGISQGTNKSESQAKTGEESLRSLFSKPFDFPHTSEEIYAYLDLLSRLMSYINQLMSSSREFSPGKDAEDYVCEAIARFINTIRFRKFNFAGEASISTFLCTIIKNLWLDDYKRGENKIQHISLDQEDMVNSDNVMKAKDKPFVNEWKRVSAAICLKEIEKKLS